MKRLIEKKLDAPTARAQHESFEKTLMQNSSLREAKDVLPFFSSNHDLSLLFSHYIPAIKEANRIATEFQIYGDFRADLVVGDVTEGKYLLVEFEDGTPTSVFRTRKKAAPSWAPRFEAAFSQLVDWLWKLDDMRQTDDFESVFGRRDVEFTGLIVIGKEMRLDAQEVKRLKWRQNKIRINSQGYSIISYEDFHEAADDWLRIFYRV